MRISKYVLLAGLLCTNPANSKGPLPGQEVTATGDQVATLIRTQEQPSENESDKMHEIISYLLGSKAIETKAVPGKPFAVTIGRIYVSVLVKEDSIYINLNGNGGSQTFHVNLTDPINRAKITKKIADFIKQHPEGTPPADGTTKLSPTTDLYVLIEWLCYTERIIKQREGILVPATEDGYFNYIFSKGHLTLTLTGTEEAPDREKTQIFPSGTSFGEIAKWLRTL